MTVPNTLPPHIIDQPKYSLEVTHLLDKTCMKMVFHDSNVITSSFPQTYDVLATSLPSIFRCKCFNTSNRPFKQEVMDTEVAHLFEHIVLEYLCSNKIACGAEDACFRGETSWDWKQDSRGVFHIWINAGFVDTFSFNDATRRAIQLFNQIVS